jgi:hypothetical protein
MLPNSRQSAAIALAGSLLGICDLFTDAGLQAPRMLIVNGRAEAMKLLLLLSNTHAVDAIENGADIQATVNAYGVWHWFDCKGLKIGWPVEPKGK